MEYTIWHIVPVNDSKPHNETTIKIGTTLQCGCLCAPKHEELANGDMLIVHHAFDGRENFEVDNPVRNN